MHIVNLIEPCLAYVSLFFIRSFSSLIASSNSLTRLRFDEISLFSSLRRNLLISGSFTISFDHNLFANWFLKDL